MATKKTNNAKDLGAAARGLLEASLRLLELLAPEDANRARKALDAGVDAFHTHVPGGCFDALKCGDVAGAAIELAHHARRRRGAK